MLLVLAVLALAPAAANASVAYLDGNGNAAAEGKPGEANNMTVRPGGDGVILTDAVGITPRNVDQGCRALSATEVTCLGEAAILLGGDGNDTLRDVGLTAGFGARGGPGDDTIVARSAVAIIYGDDRSVKSSDGDDEITGSSANPAPDPNAPPGRDFADLINGGGGNDSIHAGAGDDEASGQGGKDLVDGGVGRDNLDAVTLTGGKDAAGDAGNDRLVGGAGNDTLRAVNGKDRADGGAGDDRLLGVSDIGDDGSADLLNCGAGKDRVDVGIQDKVKLSCEKVLAEMYCSPKYPCKAKGTITGSKPKSTQTTTIAKMSKTLKSPGPVAFKLGSKAADFLGSRKSASVFLQVSAKRDGEFAGSTFFAFILAK